MSKNKGLWGIIKAIVFGDQPDQPTTSISALSSKERTGVPELLGTSSAPYLEQNLCSSPILCEYQTVGGKTYVVPHFISSGGGSGGGGGPVTQATTPWVITGLKGTLVDHSGATPDAIDHVVVPANAARNYLLIQNQSIGDMFIDFGVTAVLDIPSIRLLPGQSIVFEGAFVPAADVHLIGITGGLKYCIKEG